MILQRRFLLETKSALLGQRTLTTIVARSKFRPNRAAAKSKTSNTADSAGSWPRSVVIGFFSTLTVVVPYTISWYLSQHIESRELVSNILNLEDTAWDPIRRRFGERDYAGGLDTYKFEDEPDCNIRQAHVEAVRRDQGTVTVKVAHLTDGDTDGFSTEELSVMPASSLARAETFSKEANVALEFPDEDAAQDETSIESDLDALPSTTHHEPVPYQVYSSWYYHPESNEEQTTTHQMSSRSLATSELAAIEAELAQLDQEVKQGRAMDDPYVQDRMRQLKADRRRLQWNRWFGK